MNTIHNKIILFDGVCNLCNRSVDFIIRNDKKHIFRFASMQSQTGINLLKKFTLESYAHQTVVLIDNRRYHTRSSAILRICRELSFPYNFLYVFIIIPKPIRNYLYDFISKRRFKWFGKRDSCRLPTPEEKSLFLN